MSSPTWSPPSSPDLDENHIVPTDHRGMITDPTQSPSPSKNDGLKPSKRKRRAFQYVSPHFAPPQTDSMKSATQPKRKRQKFGDEKENRELSARSSATPSSDGRIDKATEIKSITGRRRKERGAGNIEEAKGQDRKKLDSMSAEDLFTLDGIQARSNIQSESTNGDPESSAASQSLQRPRIILGINIDELSSDSDLTDVPVDIGPDPFSASSRLKRRSRVGKRSARVVAVKEEKPASKPKKTGLTKSPYFPHPHKPRPTFLSTLPFPPLHHTKFGLMQERLHRDPFRLLLATIFLNKTPGARAMPIFFRLMEKYPTPQALADADQPDVTDIIHELGFQNQRARKCIAMAKMWVQDPPVRDRRWRKLGYPSKGDGKDVKEGEVIDDGDDRVAWEISHLPGLGPYSHDSWRMFCRDQLRGLSSGYDGQESKDGFEPEWKRVLPADKELRAWMTWMWMKEGWVWNKETGERTKASDELMELAKGKGNVVLESENNTLTVKPLDRLPSATKSNGASKAPVRVEAPAGDFVPQSDNVG